MWHMKTINLRESFFISLFINLNLYDILYSIDTKYIVMSGHPLVFYFLTFLIHPIEIL